MSVTLIANPRSTLSGGIESKKYATRYVMNLLFLNANADVRGSKIQTTQSCCLNELNKMSYFYLFPLT